VIDDDVSAAITGKTPESFSPKPRLGAADRGNRCFEPGKVEIRSRSMVN
jgi:hypothetical protein